MENIYLNYWRYRVMKGIKLSILILIISSLLFSSCSVESLIDNLWLNREYIGQSFTHIFTVADAKGTYLLKSSRMFYPDGIPEDPAVLPDLSSKNLSKIEGMLSNVLGKVKKTQKRHKKLLSKYFSGFDLKLSRSSLKILNQGAAVTATEGSGRIFVDAKVIQAIYRSALLSVLIEDNGSDITKDQEKEAFASFAEISRQIEEMSPALPLSDLGAFMRGVGGGGDEDAERNKEDPGSMLSEGEKEGIETRLLRGMMVGMFGVLESRLTDSVLISLSNELESSFLGAIEFMLAHEMSHLVLGHFPLTNDCVQAREREAIADKYGVLLNALSTYDSLPTVKIKRKRDKWEDSDDNWTDPWMSTSSRFDTFSTYDDWSSVKTERTEDEWEVTGKSFTALRTHAPSNFDAFFRYVYTLAEFENVMTALPECQYLSAEERTVVGARFHWVLDKTLKQAQQEDAMRRARWDVETGNFEAHFSDIMNDVGNWPDGMSKDYIEKHAFLLRDVFYTYYKKAR